MVQFTITKTDIPTFTSYAHHDSRTVNQLMTELEFRFKSSKDFNYSPWTDRKILAGEDWDGKIKQAIADSTVGLMLLSPAFLASDYVKTVEIPPYLREGKILIPVMVRKVDFNAMNLEGLETKQIYSHRGKCWEECRGPEKTAFVNELFVQIEKRLKD